MSGKRLAPEVNAYIARSAAFAQPLLTKLRNLFHQACPEIEETMKWGHPHFEYRGLVAGMAAFKQHVSFGFWKGELLNDPHKLFPHGGKTGRSWAQYSDVAELPPDAVLLEYIREAVALNEQGVKVPAARKSARKGPMPIPEYFQAALDKDEKARATFDAFSPSHQREYVEWLTEAKTEATRARRLATALIWLAEGKPRNWKYMKRK